MRVVSVSVRDFRSYETAAAPLGGGLTVVCGANGAGKTNLLEAIYFGCTGRSCRTSNERELVRFGAQTTRVVVSGEDELGHHELTVGFSPGEPKRMTVDGASVERMLDSPHRPLVSVFLPDRLELIKGAPALRRAHLDQFVTALWPARAATRRAYAQALAQRNALISRLRAGLGSRSGLESWDTQLAQTGLALMSDRREAVATLTEVFPEVCGLLGLDGDPRVAYRPRSHAHDVEGFVEELHERIDSDLERGFTDHGPHRDDLVLNRTGRLLRTYGSQGQQRLGLLGLLLAEREVIGRLRTSVPLMLLDDVMSELDRSRRGALVELLAKAGGQALITTTELDHIPGVLAPGVARVSVTEGEITEDVTVGTVNS
jgi:DNA replication and repair protein RecF